MIDISIPVAASTPPWPGDTPWSCRWTWEMARGASVNVSATTSSPHVGTHADAPLHIRDGAAAADRLPLEAFLGPARVVSVSSDAPAITVAMLETKLAGPVHRVLLRTGRSIAGGEFPEAWPALEAETASWLIRRGVRLVGVDCPSVDPRESTDLAIHHLLFDGGACNLENLDLRDAPDGDYELVALPQRLVGLDAAPVRAILLPPGPPHRSGVVRNSGRD